MLPHAYAMALYNKERAPGTNEWDAKVCHLPAFVAFPDVRQLPKSNLTNVKDGGLSPAMQGRFERAEAANDNSFVGLPLFAAAIVCPISFHKN